MNKIIIIEGISRVGKTTLCNKINKLYNIPIYKHNNRIINYSEMNDKNEVEKMMVMLDVYRTIPSNIIFDRFHFSNAVYGILLRNYDINESINNIKKIEKYIKSVNSRCILIKVSPTDIKESSRQYGRDLTEFENYFQKLYNISILEKYNCNYNNQDELIKKLNLGV